tara:strand:- start:66 stop:239 length:174 start_codon:yes stop_codon:yes gene_type:complete
MIKNKKSKKNRSKNSLFNPYINGISPYDLAYLSSKKNQLKKNSLNIDTDFKEEYSAA